MTYDPRMGLLNGFDGHSYQFSMGVGPPSINLNGTQACIARKNILCLIMDNMIAQRETLTSETIPDLIQKAYRTKEKENEEIALKKDKAPE